MRTPCIQWGGIGHIQGCMDDWPTVGTRGSLHEHKHEHKNKNKNKSESRAVETGPDTSRETERKRE